MFSLFILCFLLSLLRQSKKPFNPDTGNWLILKFSNWRRLPSISRTGENELPERVNRGVIKSIGHGVPLPPV
jgi:hypothetical protein